MFYSDKVKALKHLLVQTRRLLKVGNVPYVFFEDTGEIGSIGMDPYENSNNFTNGTSDILNLASVELAHNFFLYNFFLTLTAAGDFRFNLTLFNDLQAAMYYTMINKNTVLLIETGMSSGLPLPYRRTEHRLYFTGKDGSYSPLFFLQTFQTSFWIYFMSILVLLFVCFLIGVKMFGKLRKQFFDLFDFVSLILGNSVNQICSLLSFRILLLSFLLLLVIFNAAFGAFLDVLMAIKKFDLPFHSINELLNRDDFVVCVINLSTAFKILLELKNKIGGKVVLNSGRCPETDPKSFDYKKDFDFQLCNKTNMAIFFTEGKAKFDKFLIEKCNLVKFPATFFHTQATFLTAIEFPLKEILNRKIIQVQSSGNMHYITNTRILSVLGTDKLPTDHNHLEIEFEHCKLIILLFLIGSVASFVILAIEILWARRIKRINQEY